MKKRLYYFVPPLLTAILGCILSFLDKYDLDTCSKYTMYISLFLICIISGNISTSEKKFDLAITAIVPLSFCICMFLVGFLSEGDLGGRYYELKYAFEVASQPICLIIYAIQAIVTFIFSFKPIRITQIIESHKK